MRALVFLSSFLLFAAELHLGQVLLPGYGSSAAVWTTALTFFQLVLTLGYLLAGRFPLAAGRRTTLLHLALVGVPLLALPFHVLRFELPPVLGVASALTIAAGLPLLALSTTSVLAQRWHHLRRPDEAPYFLYAASNLGSLAGLLLYPFLIQRFVGLEAQAWAFVGLYLVFAVLHFRARPAVDDRAVPPGARPSARERFFWLALPAAGSAVMTAVTELLSEDAPTPVVWAETLGVYLLTLVLASGRKAFGPEGAKRLVGAGLVVFMLGLGLGIPKWVSADATKHAMMLGLEFGACFAAHWVLFARAPDAGRLSHFYLSLSIGGALGSALITFGCLAALQGVPYLWFDLLVALGLLFAAVAPKGPHPTRLILTMVAVMAFMIVARELSGEPKGRLMGGGRTFYGTLRVRESDTARALMHGNTLHGMEVVTVPGVPVSYYDPTSPVAVVFQSPRAKSVGVVGLGAGVLAAFAQDGSDYTFYELDPQVRPLAETHFTFLRSSKARITHVLGDARLTLQQTPEHRFDVLVMDAFQSDFVPTHLLTREAMGIELARVKSDGVLLFQVSNRLFRLAPFLAAVAQTHGVTARVRTGPKDGEGPLAEFHHQSIWVAVGTKESLDSWVPGWITPELADQVWTDDRVDLFAALR
ncbi:MAG: fused MFS/spermidine synthase [Myxococcaceae bacterium]|nr:fused MFS/spermidine synthase [Myxococcaceae bacterium]